MEDKGVLFRLSWAFCVVGSPGFLPLEIPLEDGRLADEKVPMYLVYAVTHLDSKPQVRQCRRQTAGRCTCKKTFPSSKKYLGWNLRSSLFLRMLRLSIASRRQDRNAVDEAGAEVM